MNAETVGQPVGVVRVWFGCPECSPAFASWDDILAAFVFLDDCEHNRPCDD